MAESSPGFLAKLASSLRSGRSSGQSTRHQSSPTPSSTSTGPPQLPPGVTLDTQTSEEREDMLNALPDVYFDPNGDTLDYELSGLPVTVTVTQLEQVAEDRTTALEAVR